MPVNADMFCLGVVNTAGVVELISIVGRTERMYVIACKFYSSC